METRVGIEERRVQEIAREYRDKGYEVVIRPGRSQLPDFLADYSPDVLACGENENLIVEVGSRTSLPRESFPNPPGRCGEPQRSGAIVAIGVGRSP